MNINVRILEFIYYLFNLVKLIIPLDCLLFINKKHLYKENIIRHHVKFHHHFHSSYSRL